MVAKYKGDDMKMVIKYMQMVVAGMIILGSTSWGESLSLSPVDDSYAVTQHASYVDTNYGSDATLLCKRADGTLVRIPYIKFNLSKIVNDDVARKITSATLKLTPEFILADDTRDYRVYGLAKDAAGQDWDELTITGNNRPASASSAPDIDVTKCYGGDKLLVFDCGTEGTQTNLSSVAMVNFLNDAISSNSVVTFIIVKDASDNLDYAAFASKNNATSSYRPVLELEYSATVEAVDDGHVRGERYGDNVYNSDILWNRYDDNVDNFEYNGKSYARFTFTGMTPDPEMPAQLTVTVVSGSGDGGTGRHLSFYGLNAGFVSGGSVLGADWSESALTWNNAPANQTGAYEFTADATALLVDKWVLYSAGTTCDITIPRLGDYIQSDGSVTIMIAPRATFDEREVSLASSENATYPGPTLTFTMLPRGTMLIVR